MFNKKEYAKKYYLRTRELQINRAKEWQKNNFKRWRKRRLERYWENPERFRKYSKEYKVKNRDFVNTRNRKSSCKFHLKRRLWWINQRCNNKKQKMYKYYGGKGVKNYLGIKELKFLWNRDNASQFNYPTIDRIDSGKDYTIKNCRFIEKELNEFLGRESKMIPRGKSINLINSLKDSGIKAPTLSKIIGVTKPQLYRWFKGKAHVSKRSFKRMTEKGVIKNGILCESPIQRRV